MSAHTPSPEFTQRFLDALRDDGIDTTCQVCGGDDWHAMQPLAIPFKGANGVGGEPALGAACARCGFLRIHLAQFANDLVIDHDGLVDGSGEAAKAD